MNYKEILIRGSLSKEDNRISNMVAPQGLVETSADPNGFTFVIPTRRTNKAIIGSRVQKEMNPYVRKSKKEIEVRNYVPTSMYTVRKLALSSRSPKSVNKRSGMKKVRRRERSLVKEQIGRREQFHEKQCNQKIQRDVTCKIKKMSKKQRHKLNPNKLDVRTPKSIKKMRLKRQYKEFVEENIMEDTLKSYHQFFETMRSKKSFLFKGYNKCIHLGKLSRTERLQLKKHCDELYSHTKKINRLQTFLEDLELKCQLREKLRQEAYKKATKNMMTAEEFKLIHSSKLNSNSNRCNK